MLSQYISTNSQSFFAFSWNHEPGHRAGQHFHVGSPVCTGFSFLDQTHFLNMGTWDSWLSNCFFRTACSCKETASLLTMVKISPESPPHLALHRKESLLSHHTRKSRDMMGLNWLYIHSVHGVHIYPWHLTIFMALRSELNNDAPVIERWKLKDFESMETAKWTCFQILKNFLHGGSLWNLKNVSKSGVLPVEDWMELMLQTTSRKMKRFSNTV